MFDPYFDQEEPQIPVDGMIADLDLAGSYEMNQTAVFKAGHRFLVVHISGFSCWPDRGGTYQAVWENKSDMDKVLRGGWAELLQKCQDAGWNVTRTE